MNKRISTTKLNILVLSYLIALSAIYSIFVSFDLKGFVFFSLIALFASSTFILFYRKYKPFVKEIRFNGNSFFMDGKYFYDYQIIGIYEIGPAGKALFTLRSPHLDFTSSFLSKGLILKTMHDSIMIDDIDREYINKKRISRRFNIKLDGIIFYLLSLLPFVILYRCIKTGIDPIWYAFAVLVFLFVAVLRFLPPFYLGSVIDHSSLPLNHSELMEFKKTTIIKGFVLTDKLSVLPFSKRTYLDGLAVDIFLKRYIVLNPRLFVLGSDDYLRFVLFHELCHIKHHDGSMGVIIPSVLVVLDIILSIFPSGVTDNIPYFDYIILAAAALYVLFSIKNRKNIEKRADTYGMNRIGKSSVENIHRELGIDLH